MQQRQLRLGDILDDYCPRERRLANHTIVAMVGDEVRLTRCTTCDTEHVYKGGKVPRLRKKSPVQAAYDEVLDSVKKDGEGSGTLVTRPEHNNGDEDALERVEAAQSGSETTNGSSPDGEPPVDPVEHEEPAPEEIRLHRPLIRASLPRTVETQPTPRPIPEFTIRQASRQGRFQKPGGGGRFAKGRGGANMNNHQGGGRPQGHGAPGRPPRGRNAGQNQFSNKKRTR